MAEQARVLRWQSPPHSKRPPTMGRRSSIYDEAAVELRDNPRMWGVIYEGEANRAAGLTSCVRTGTLPCFRPAGTFEAVSRLDHGVRTVYARYLGDHQENA